MTERIGIRELRENLTATIRRVRSGATVEITHHHEPVAVLMGVGSGRLASLHEAGDVTPGVPLERPLRRFSPTSGLTASAALEEDRAER